MTRFKGKIGEEYDLINLAIPHLLYFEDLLGKEIQNYTSNLSGPINVLEFGCGTGITTKRILAANPNIKITAIDNERVTLEQAQNNLQEYSDRVKFVLADGLDYLSQQPKEKFEIFASACCIHNLNTEYRSKVLQEAYKTLRPGGLFVNMDKYASADPLQHQQDLEWQLKMLDIYTQVGKPELKAAWIKHYQEDESPERIMLIDYAFKEMQQVGFKQMQCKSKLHMDALVIALK